MKETLTLHLSKECQNNPIERLSNSVPVFSKEDKEFIRRMIEFADLLLDSIDVPRSFIEGPDPEAFKETIRSTAELSVFLRRMK